MYYDFNDWLAELPHRYEVVIPGNHDFLMEDENERDIITNATLLVDSGIEIEGLRIWGSPMTPLCGGAFGMPNAKDRSKHWARMPQALDILITHNPPYGILDIAPGSQQHLGCAELLEAVELVEPRLHVFGHVHGARGMLPTKNTVFVNAELFGESGDMDGIPIVVELDPIRRSK
jgi:Icc-related predicted phosphoesterase